MTHKYHADERDAQADIKEAGFPITILQPGARTGGPAHNPTFSDPIPITLYALDVSDDQKFRRDTAVAKYEKIFMVSTENVTAGNKPSIGTDVEIAPTDAFPNLPRQTLQITELRELSPAGVPIFYTFVLEGRTAAAEDDAP